MNCERVCQNLPILSRRHFQLYNKNKIVRIKRLAIKVTNKINKSLAEVRPKMKVVALK